jgi:hypothetical protein
MKKKMIIAVVFVAALAITASAVFASQGQRRTSRDNNCCDSRDKECCPSVEINAGTNTTLRNEVKASASSGDNYVTSTNSVMPTKYDKYDRDRRGDNDNTSSASIDSGDVIAYNDVINDIEGSVVKVDAPREGRVEVNAETNTRLTNDVSSRADSGDNTIRISGGRAEIETGNAHADNKVDTTVLGAEVTVN